MTKYSFELKQKVVQAYQNEEGGYNYIAQKYGISDKSIIRRWNNAYLKFGLDGLVRSRKSQAYSLDFKLHVVELYLTTEGFYQESTLNFGMNNP
jgi:transposase